MHACTVIGSVQLSHVVQVCEDVGVPTAAQRLAMHMNDHADSIQEISLKFIHAQSIFHPSKSLSSVSPSSMITRHRITGWTHRDGVHDRAEPTATPSSPPSVGRQELEAIVSSVTVASTADSTLCMPVASTSTIATFASPKMVRVSGAPAEHAWALIRGGKVRPTVSEYDRLNYTQSGM